MRSSLYVFQNTSLTEGKKGKEKYLKHNRTWEQKRSEEWEIFVDLFHVLKYDIQ